MKRLSLTLLLVVFFSLFAGSAIAALATTGSVYLDPEPGSWVGDGIGADEVTWVHGVDGVFSITSNSDQGASVSFNMGSYWSFAFAAPEYSPETNTLDGNRLEVGFYNYATRYPFNSPTKPGLNFSGGGRGNNKLGGWFHILEVEYGDGGEVLKLAVDFRQFDESESMIGPSTYGSLRINSDIPLNCVSNVPLPAAVWLFGSGLLGLVGYSRRKKAIVS
jgi:hypothetical protein